MAENLLKIQIVDDGEPTQPRGPAVGSPHQPPADGHGSPSPAPVPRRDPPPPPIVNHPQPPRPGQPPVPVPRIHGIDPELGDLIRAIASDKQAAKAGITEALLVKMHPDSVRELADQMGIKVGGRPASPPVPAPSAPAPAPRPGPKGPFTTDEDVEKLRRRPNMPPAPSGQSPTPPAPPPAPTLSPPKPRDDPAPPPGWRKNPSGGPPLPPLPPDPKAIGPQGQFPAPPPPNGGSGGGFLDDLFKGLGKQGVGTAAGAFAGATGTGAAGAAAASSALSGVAAAAGPAALAIGAVAAGSHILTKQMENARNQLRHVGDGMVSLANNDHMGLLTSRVDAAADMMRQIPIVGEIQAKQMELMIAPMKEYQRTVEAFVQRGQELQRFSGELAGANAIANVKRLEADIKESEALGKGLAKLTENSAETEVNLRELILPVKEGMTDILAAISEIVAEVTGIMKEFAPLIKFGVQLSTAFPIGVLRIIGRVFELLHEALKKWTGADEDDKDDDLNSMMQQLFDSLDRIPPPAAGRPGRVGGQLGPILGGL